MSNIETKKQREQVKYVQGKQVKYVQGKQIKYVQRGIL